MSSAQQSQQCTAEQRQCTAAAVHSRATAASSAHAAEQWQRTVQLPYPRSFIASNIETSPPLPGGLRFTRWPFTRVAGILRNTCGPRHRTQHSVTGHVFGGSQETLQ